MYNKLVRGYGYYGALYGKIADRRDHYFDGCFDCTLEMLILLDYSNRFPDDLEGVINTDRLVELFKQKDVQDTLFRLRRQIDSVVINAPDSKCIFHGRLCQPTQTPLYYGLRDNDIGGVDVLQLWLDPKTLQVMTKKLNKQSRGLSPAQNVKPDPRDSVKFWARVAKSMTRALNRES
jgi:hypothetical protein